MLDNALKVRGQIDLGYIDEKFYLFLIAELPDKPENTREGFLGVDLGIVKIATTSDGKFYSGSKIKNLRRQRKESRFAADVNHCISKKLVESGGRAGYLC